MGLPLTQVSSPKPNPWIEAIDGRQPNPWTKRGGNLKSLSGPLTTTNLWIGSGASYCDVPPQCRRAWAIAPSDAGGSLRPTKCGSAGRWKLHRGDRSDTREERWENKERRRRSAGDLGDGGGSSVSLMAAGACGVEVAEEARAGMRSSSGILSPH